MIDKQNKYEIETINNERFEISRKEAIDLIEGEFIITTDEPCKFPGIKLGEKRILWINKNYIRKIELTEK